MADEATPQILDAVIADTAASETDWRAEAEKWKGLSRKHEGTAKANADAAQRLAQIEEAQKTAEQKAADRAAESDARAAAAELKALRLEVAFAKGIPPESREFLTGDTQEELEAKADRLLALIRREPVEEKGDMLSVRPKEALKSGSTNAQGDEIVQLTRDDLKGKSFEWIEEARVAGRLNKIQGIT
jgi:hypothetical protein